MDSNRSIDPLRASYLNFFEAQVSNHTPKEKLSNFGDLEASMRKFLGKGSVSGKMDIILKIYHPIRKVCPPAPTAGDPP